LLNCGLGPAHAERGHDHIEPDEGVVDQGVANTILVLDELSDKRESYRHDAHLPDPGTLLGHFWVAPVVLGLRPDRQVSSGQITDQGDKYRFAGEPHEDRCAAEDENDCLVLGPDPVTLPYPGRDHDQCRRHTPAELDVRLVVSGGVSEVEADEVENENDGPGGEVRLLLAQPHADAVETSRERAENSAEQVQRECEFFHGGSFREICGGLN
jgi:hypothetical protein